MKVKVKMSPMGKEQKIYPEVVSPSAEAKKKQVIYPKLTLTSDSLPDVAGVEYGETVHLMLEAEVCEVRAGDAYETDSEKKGEVTATFKLLSGKIEEMEEDDDESTSTIDALKAAIKYGKRKLKLD